MYIDITNDLVLRFWTSLLIFLHYHKYVVIPITVALVVGCINLRYYYDHFNQALLHIR